MLTTELVRQDRRTGNAVRATTKLLVVGPLPPPVAGTSVSFQTFCSELEKYADSVTIDVINSAPRHLGQTRLFTAAHFATARNILWQFCTKIRRTDQALIFSNDQFLFSLVPICLTISKLAGKRCHIRTFGGSLDQSYEKRSITSRWFFRKYMRRADGLIVQSRLLKDYFRRMLGDKVHLVPGYREVPASGHEPGTRNAKSVNGPFRVVYLGHVRDEKGVFVLLESLRRLHAQGEHVVGHICGPVYDDVMDRFQHDLSTVPNAKYLGVIEPEAVIATLRQYDVLAFPSYFTGEGHPGVLIEAMMAGVPVIATRFRSIPEIVQDGVNGLLVSPQDPDDLALAIRRLAHDRRLAAELGRNNFEKREQYMASELVPRILRSMGI